MVVPKILPKLPTLPRRSMRGDRGGYTFIVSPLTIAAYAIIMVAMISYYLHTAGLFQDTFMADVFHFSPVLIAAGVGLMVSRFTPDPKFFITIGLVAAAAYYIFLVI
jgi:hypothetical protein